MPGSVHVVRCWCLYQTAVVNLQELGLCSMPIFRAHETLLLVGDTSNHGPHVHVGVTPNVQGGTSTVDLIFQLQAAACHVRRTSARKLLHRKEMAEGDGLAPDASLLLILLDLLHEEVVPHDEPLVGYLVAHGPLAEGIIDEFLISSEAFSANEGGSPPGQQRHHIDIGHHLGRHHLRTNLVTHVKHGQQLLDRVLEFELI
mmetsp:Transcript_61829/g.139326  ORF Transcript_61829/g.139326 Transcript_61829/m.139326 type:complete len:201 (+) Transcript_61829:96-698(+)